ncbi:DUF86 domain-containing protein [Ectobacillus ponti]|uniref:DUF86 domain-containing protein n=1 Tax=Ectobacillus ponti TaxID=2961894 RepID=A0AA41XBD0_9BACI|nr:DUF86 domain-containing protein [Ectobacillus ponti]MCP8969758.1 DUF86 domain-containing protein [Ectobacillus ponti]
MYFVDRKKIEQTLQHLENVLAAFQEQQDFSCRINQYALERLAQLAIDCVLDVGNAMIDGFIMRDPGSYEDIIEILTDEKVVQPEEGTALKQVVRLRKMLIQDYIAVQHEEVLAVLREHFAVLAAYPSHVRRYLEQELGPVSAFSNS